MAEVNGASKVPKTSDPIQTGNSTPLVKKPTNAQYLDIDIDGDATEFLLADAADDLEMLTAARPAREIPPQITPELQDQFTKFIGKYDLTKEQQLNIPLKGGLHIEIAIRPQEKERKVAVWVMKDGAEGSLATLIADQNGKLIKLVEGLEVSGLSRDSVALFYESSADLPMKPELIHSFHIPSVTPELKKRVEKAEILSLFMAVAKNKLRITELDSTSGRRTDESLLSPKRERKNADELLSRSSNTDPQIQIEQLLTKADFLFIGETHLVADEEIFIPMLEKLYKSGVKNLVVEFGTDQQKGLDHFLTTGDPSQLSRPFDLVVKNETGLVNLMKAAHKVGLKVVCMDMPFSEQPKHSIEERESYMKDQLLNLKGNGKTMVVVGGAHAGIDKLPFSSLRTLVEENGIKTAGVKLESKAAIEAAEFTQFWNPVGLFTAFDTYFSEKEPTRPIAINASLLGGLSFIDPSAPGRERDARLNYSKAFDLVIFLPRNQSRPLM